MSGWAPLGLATLLLAAGAGGDPLTLDEARARIGALFALEGGEAQELRVAVEAIENGPEGRLPLERLEAELAGLFAARGVPRTPAAEAQPGVLAMSCRVGLSEVEAGETGWSQVRWDGTCDLSRRGRIGLATARAGGASHPDPTTARDRARDAARESLVAALERRLVELPAAQPAP